MKTKTMLGAASMLALLGGPVMAQTMSPNNGTGGATCPTATTGAATDKSAASNDQTSKVTTDGYLRTSKLEGADVYNSADTSIGTVDDLLIGQREKAATAVISVGGFLGIGSKLVQVPFSRLKLNKEGHLVMAGATKASLTRLPAYAYNK